VTRNERSETPWWKTFFEGLYGDYQASGLREEAAPSQTDWIVRKLALKPGDCVLDAPTGAGRIALELARRGFAVTGVDFNDAVLDRARTLAAQDQVAVEWLRVDIRQFSRPNFFDHAICFSASIGYFSELDDLAFFQNVAQSLKPGGRFLVDTPIMESVFPRFDRRDWAWFRVGGRGIRVLEEREFDLATSRIESTWTFVEPDGRVEDATFSIRLYSYRELCELLRKAGFESFTALETHTDKPFRLGAHQLGLIAELP
jgi:SAM-dependent methyltransferase